MDNEEQSTSQPNNDAVVTFGQLRAEVNALVLAAIAPEISALRTEISNVRQNFGQHVDAVIDTVRDDLKSFAQGVEPKIEARLAYLESYLGNFLTRHFGTNHGFDPATPAAPTKDPAAQTEETQKNNG